MIISGVDEKVVVNHGSLYSGLSEKEYTYHSIENRICFRKIIKIAKTFLLKLAKYKFSTTIFIRKNDIV